MSGHSKWHNIQKTKGAQDAKRAAAFTKISKEMIVAVKEGGGIADPAYNSRLATVITKAKAANMPNDNIKRTIDKALGSGNADSYENVVYEGYGPSGVAVIVDALTDNRNRTAPEVRHLLDKYGKEVPGTWAELVATAKEIVEQEGNLEFVTEHVIGDGKGASKELWEGLQNHFMGECTEVGMYLAMSRQADREGYPEIAEAYKRYAWEEAEHASKFAELIGEVVWDTKTNLYKRMNAESGACEDKMRLARMAKEQNLDAVHDTVHEMAKDEARHGKGFEGLYKRYFGK